MTPAEPGWSALKSLVIEALDLPVADRSAYLNARCSDLAQRAEANQLLQACEEAAANPVLDLPAMEFAAPVLAAVYNQEREVPEALVSALAGRYTIERELERGGMATVYLARDERHGRPVALKLLRAELAPDDGPLRSAARFQREIEYAARLSHPHVLPLFDSGAVDGWLYYIMPYVDGETLRHRLDRTGPPPLHDSLRLLRDVARALAHAHGQGLMHCDIKPANILLSREGDALVADFGVARGLAAARRSGEGTDDEPPDEAIVLGTPAYMAPEQVVGSLAIDHRADLYALGAVAYELLTGEPPFAGRPRHEQFAAHLMELPQPVASRRSDVPVAIADLVDRLLAKHPRARPRDAAEVVRLLDAAAVGGGTQPISASALGTGEKRTARAVQGSVRDRGTSDQGAYEFCLKGRFLLNTRQRDGLLRALSYFEEAIALDACYARAHAGMADAWTFLGIFGHMPPLEAFPKAQAAAERSVALDDRLIEGHATLAHLQVVYAWDWRAAESAFQRAIAIDAGYPTIRMYRASFLHAVGRPAEALEQLAVARELDPLTPIGLLSGRIYVDTHRPDAAIEILREEIDLDPRHDLAHQLLAHAYLQKGMHDDAVASMRRAAGLNGPRDQAQLAYVHAKTGDHAEARRLLARLLDGGQALDVLGFHLGMAYAALGEADEAFRWLEAAHAQRGSFMSLLAVATGFEPIRADPRFTDLLRRMGLR